MSDLYLFVCLTIFCTVKLCEGGECCKAHYSLLASKQDEKWCRNYCCFHVPNLYDCCDNEVLRAPESEREDFCLAFFTSNIWAPIVAAVVGILLLVGCCVCCYKCCCATRQTPVIVQAPQQPSGMVLMNQQSMAQIQPPAGSNPYSAGYNQVPTGGNLYAAGYDQPNNYYK